MKVNTTFRQKFLTTPVISKYSKGIFYIILWSLFLLRERCNLVGFSIPVL
jgi:hypothetical protein